MPTLRAVFFDLDDTLVLTSEHDKRAFEAVGKLAASRMPGLDPAALIKAFKVHFGAEPWDPELKVEVTEWRAGLWKRALSETTAAAAAADTSADTHAALSADLQRCFDATRLGHFPFDEGVEGMCAELERRGVRTVIITNGHHAVQRAKLAACSPAAYALFPLALVGGEEVLQGRPEKPAAGIFHAACVMAGCAPGEAAHVGDSLGSDIQGAINAGLAASVWVNPSGKPPPPGGPVPTFTVQRVADAIQALAALLPAAAPAGSSA